jgi:hypothetical protein
MRSPYEIDDFVGFHLYYSHLTFLDLAEIIPTLFRDVEILEVTDNGIRYRINSRYKQIVINIDNFPEIVQREN